MHVPPATALPPPGGPAPVVAGGDLRAALADLLSPAQSPIVAVVFLVLVLLAVLGLYIGLCVATFAAFMRLT